MRKISKKLLPVLYVSITVDSMLRVIQQAEDETEFPQD